MGKIIGWLFLIAIGIIFILTVGLEFFLEIVVGCAIIFGLLMALGLVGFFDQ